MIGSFVHVAFDPLPYVAFSACVEAIGILVELRRSGFGFHGVDRTSAADGARNGARPAHHVTPHSVGAARM